MLNMMPGKKAEGETCYFKWVYLPLKTKTKKNNLHIYAIFDANMEL